ncbi:hypothetical protein [Pseudoduganella sp.]|uniref:hypothetical protein n=1 Tax=Pseudoduganella sp. TaxID=1880898 RepID=UPI0035B137FD
MKIQTLKSILLKVVMGLVLLAVLSLLVLVLINSRDEKPSAATLSLTKIADSAPSINDTENAFIYVMGFDAPDDVEPMPAGVAKVAQLRSFMAAAGTHDLPPSSGNARPNAEKRDPQLNQLAAVCKNDNRGCASEIQRSVEHIEHWMQAHAKLIQRYESLLEFRQWHELWPSDPRTPHAPFRQVLEAQRLALLKAWLRADKGDQSGSVQLLEKDLQFWRMVLRESSSVIVKTIAARGLEQHFALGNLVSRRIQAAPHGWQVPFSQSERSMAKVMANEWKFFNLHMQQAASELAGESKWSALPGQFTFQPQATSNTHAEHMLGLAKVFDLEVAAIPAAVAKLAESTSHSRIYNPVGNVLVEVGDPQLFAKYGYQVADLEGMRRMALLASQLRREGATAEGVLAGTGTSKLRDPYDGSSYAWIQESGTLAFHRPHSRRPDFELLY